MRRRFTKFYEHKTSSNPTLQFLHNSFFMFPYTLFVPYSPASERVSKQSQVAIIQTVKKIIIFLLWYGVFHGVSVIFFLYMAIGLANLFSMRLRYFSPEFYKIQQRIAKPASSIPNTFSCRF